MILFSYDFSFILLVFPGFLLTAISIFLWSILSNYMLTKIDKNNDMSLFQVVSNAYKKFDSRILDQKYSKGFIFLLLEFIVIILFQILILGNFFGLNNFNGYFLLFILFIGVLLESFYQLDMSSNMFIFVGKIFSGFIIILSLGLLFEEQGVSTFVSLSNNLVYHFSLLDGFLFIIILFSISKLSTYMDYRKIPVFQSTPNDTNIYKEKIEKGNVLENSVRWLFESFHQIVLVQLLVLMFFPLLNNLLVIQGPLWIQFFLFLVFQVFFLLIALFLNLFNSTLEVKIPNQQSRGIVFILLLIMVAVLA